MKVRSRLLNVSIFLLSTALSCLVAEIGLRLAAPPPSKMLLERGLELHRRYFSADPVLGLRRRPNVDFLFPFEEHESGAIRFRTNNQGLRRNENTTYEKPPGARRILILGDSHVDGAVDNTENLTALLEARLNRDSLPPGWQVLNAAVGSYSPYQNYLWYRETGKRYAPDLVLLTFYLGNDLAELATEDRPRLVKRSGNFVELGPSPGSAQDPVDPGILGRLERYAARNSYFYGHLSDLASGLAELGPGKLRPADYFGCVAQSLAQASWTSRKQDYEQNCEIFREMLRRLRGEVERDGGQLWLVILPSRLLVEPELDRERISKMSAALGLKPGDLKLEDRLARDLLSMGQGQGVRVLDLRDDFRVAHQNQGRPLYYEFDWHINAFGHRTAAESIYRALRLVANSRLAPVP